MKRARVLFKRTQIESDPAYVGTMVRADIPVVLCGACGKGVCLPIVNQSCSANCGAYVFEVIAETDRLRPHEQAQIQTISQ
jgi:hypothetical protein